MQPSHALRRRSSLIIALFTMISVLTLTWSGSSAGVLLRQLSSDPYTNGSSQHKTEVEPDTFSYGNTVVAAFQVGRFTDGGGSNVGWATSTDNGRTWTNGFLPGVTIYNGGSYQRATDPVVAYDPLRGVWMIVTLPLNDAGSLGQGVLVSRSTDGGLTWANPVAVVQQIGLDKTWISCDTWQSSPYYGNCYTEWDDNFAGNLIHMSTSTDGGLTWGPVLSPSNSPSGLGGVPVSLPNGRVVVPYSGNYATVSAFVSTDGGASWGPSIDVSYVNTGEVGGGLRTPPMPSAEVDASGKVYVVWYDCRFRSGCSSNDIVMSTSTDGLSWSNVIRVPIDPVNSTVDHFIPGIGVDRTTQGSTAHLGITYYYYPNASCTTSTCRLNVGFIGSPDGGDSWGQPVRVAESARLTWLANTTQGPMVGDYISTSFTADGTATTSVAFAHAPTNGVYDEAMYAPLIPWAVTSDQKLTPVRSDEPVYSVKHKQQPVQGFPVSQ